MLTNIKGETVNSSMKLSDFTNNSLRVRLITKQPVLVAFVLVL